MQYRLGLDIGSTTIKAVLLEDQRVVYSQYRRHMSDVRGELRALLGDIGAAHGGVSALVSITGSGGLSVAQSMKLGFVQEVVACSEAVLGAYPEADTAIELGGEDAKLMFFHPTPEQRMNGTCAGGTGAFIDQMASLLRTDAAGLNTLAEQATTMYPIASRCGVFAKTDMQPLLNEGAAREDLALSVLQAVVNQTIAGLAQGRNIHGNIVFLGGPLHFLPQLRALFEKTLAGEGQRFFMPEDAQLFVARGAARLAKGEPVRLEALATMLEEADAIQAEITRMPALFESEADYKAFRGRHGQCVAERADPNAAQGPLYVGMDAGSTTLKAVVCDANGAVVFTSYRTNSASPLDAARDILKDIYAALPEGAVIARSCATGYGERLIQTAFGFDEGVIETVAHTRAARHFRPDVDLILDIGGQDMKCMRLKEGVIDEIMLNEACSSGCGSFIQTFAQSLGMTTEAFAEAALHAQNPVDLGTRCTVFMNSRVKQAQKEGATPGDISAGLSYSVIRNALYKVIKMRDPALFGRSIVAQGGTFLNDAVLRAFEHITGREVSRPDIAGVMGAYGAALLARDHAAEGAHSALIARGALDVFQYRSAPGRCKQCTNACRLTITRFGGEGGRSYIAGNRCERGAPRDAGEADNRAKLPNLFEYKLKRVFAYKPLEESEAPRGVIGMPRALNMYENYPLWFTVFTELGFSVRLSRESDHKLFELGMDTIPSESVCYGAKLVHGHIKDLINAGVRTIFYPSLPFERKEFKDANNHYNCPIVTSYPEAIANNVDALEENGVRLIHPFLPLHHRKKLARRLKEELRDYGVTLKEARTAVKRGIQAQQQYKRDVMRKGEEAMRYLEESGGHGIVLAGRPYHVDPELNHGIPQMIVSLGLAVLSEDSVCHLAELERPLRVVDQWVYATRLYKTAEVVARTPYLELVQLNSFGCGLDAITTDQVHELLNAHGRIYTLLKIDEVSNLGAARIRIRSLKAAMEQKAAGGGGRRAVSTFDRVLFTKDMRAEHTIIAPQMAPTHFSLLRQAFRAYGYRMDVLKDVTPEDVECGLKYVNNDACYPSIIVTGQIVNAFLSGRYDPEKTSVMITQTGGGCRATNYIAFIRKALKEAGFPRVAVVSLSFGGLEKNPGLTFTPAMLGALVKAAVLGDLLQTVVLRTRPYELNKGAANALEAQWMEQCARYLRGDKDYTYKGLVRGITRAFDNLPIDEDTIKPRVGVVGEILVKFHPDANNHVVDLIEREGSEAVAYGLADFIIYSVYNASFKRKALGNSRVAETGGKLAIRMIEAYRAPVRAALRRSARFDPPSTINEIAEGAHGIISLGNCTGEGWFLTGEMVELIKSGVSNIICVQPFACLPNHVTGKAMIKALKRRYPSANIVAIDYDPGASEVNQLNRIKLMMATAHKNAEARRPEVRRAPKNRKIMESGTTEAKA